MRRMPNILFVQTDQLTIDVLGAYGNPVAVTPTLDRLADDGVVFDDFYCNFPLCAPSRASMATGMLASRIGAYDNAAELPAGMPTYAHYLRRAGYYTSLCGKMHFDGPDQLHGFETRRTTDIYPGDFSWTPDWSQTGFHGATDARVLTDAGVCARSVQLDYDDEVTHQAVREIYDRAAGPDNRPFFLQVSYTHPHDPYLCRKAHWDLYEDRDIPPPRTDMIAPEANDPHSRRLLAQHGFDKADVPAEAIAAARRAYCGSVSYIDDQLAQLISALEDSGQRDNTVIVFTSDHGEMLGERGLWLKKVFFEPSLRVPMIINAPGRFAARRVTTPGSLVDLLPTMLDFAGAGDAPLGQPVDGRSLAPMARGGPCDDGVATGDYCAEMTASPVFMIRRGALKYIHCEDDPPQLYDLAADPLERRNLAADPAWSEVAAAFAAEVAARWNSAALRDDVIASQASRRTVFEAMQQGRRTDWDHNPHRDAAQEYVRNHIDWTVAAEKTRYPPPGRG